jgi:glycosyltransferase involved in cell wall biosynthesis
MGAPAFDNAPVVVTEKCYSSKDIQFVYPYYENPMFLERQIRHWLRYPKSLRCCIRAIVVDDGSPDNAAVDVLRSFPELPFSVRLFRIEVDVRWNWLAARNIGMHHATSGWCVVTDMDHMIPAAVAERLITCRHDEAVIYRFSRVEHTGEAIHPHPNSMFMQRSVFWKVGGYDEELSGFYGTLSDALERHEHVGDSSTVKYLRKQLQDAGKKAIVARRGPTWRPKVLSFPYHEVHV